MAEKIQIEVINLEADKLQEGSKFIFLVEPMWAYMIDEMYLEFSRIGLKDFIILPLPSDSFKAYQVAKESEN